MTKQADWPDNPFWDFSLDFYSRDGVAPLLLKFQEDWQADVNLLLYCCWAGVAGAPRFTESEMVAVCQVVECWQSEVVMPLRTIRKSLKKDTRGGPGPWAGEVRDSVQQAELTAEQLQQLMLYSSAPLSLDEERDQDDRCRATVSNLILYMTQVAGEPDSQKIDAINQLVEALFD